MKKVNGLNYHFMVHKLGIWQIYSGICRYS